MVSAATKESSCVECEVCRTIREAGEGSERVKEGVVEKKRLIGAMIISIVNFVIGLPLLLLYFRSIISHYGKFLAQLGDFSLFSVFVLSLHLLMSLSVVYFASLFIYAGILTYNFKPSSIALNKGIARWTIVFVGGCEVFFALFFARHLMIKTEFSLLVTLVVILYFMWVQMYLTRPKVKAQFK